MTRLGIVTLNMNQSRFLLDALTSIQRQSMKDWELIIVDPGSTDGAENIYRMPEICQDSRIHVIREPDRGPADGLNKGFDRVDADNLYYLNADDRTLPNSFEESLEILEQKSSPYIVNGHGFVIDEAGRRVRRIFSDHFNPRGYVQGICVSVQQASFFNRSALIAADGFNIENRVSWDGEFIFDASLSGAKIKTVNRFWGEFRIYTGSITESPSTVQLSNQALARLRDRSYPGTNSRATAVRRLHRRLRNPRRSLYLLTNAMRSTRT